MRARVSVSKQYYTCICSAAEGGKRDVHVSVSEHGIACIHTSKPTHMRAHTSTEKSESCASHLVEPGAGDVLPP